MIATPTVDVASGNLKRKQLLAQMMQRYSGGGNPSAAWGQVKPGAAWGQGGVTMAGGLPSHFLNRSASPTFGMRTMLNKRLTDQLGPGGYGIPGMYEASGEAGVPVGRQEGTPQPIPQSNPISAQSYDPGTGTGTIAPDAVGHATIDPTTGGMVPFNDIVQKPVGGFPWQQPAPMQPPPPPNSPEPQLDPWQRGIYFDPETLLTKFRR